MCVAPIVPRAACRLLACVRDPVSSAAHARGLASRVGGIAGYAVARQLVALGPLRHIVASVVLIVANVVRLMASAVVVDPRRLFHAPL